MKQLESNIIQSFTNVRRDIAQLHEALTQVQRQFGAQISQLQKENAQLREAYATLAASSKKSSSSSKPKTVTKTITKTVTKKKPTQYVTTKTGKKFHVESCPFAKNIKPSNRVSLTSKVAALNQGLKPCECVKKY